MQDFFFLYQIFTAIGFTNLNSHIFHLYNNIHYQNPSHMVYGGEDWNTNPFGTPCILSTYQQIQNTWWHETHCRNHIVCISKIAHPTFYILLNKFLKSLDLTRTPVKKFSVGIHFWISWVRGIWGVGSFVPWIGINWNSWHIHFHLEANYNVVVAYRPSHWATNQLDPDCSAQNNRMGYPFEAGRIK